jgi:hypothetical protein
MRSCLITITLILSIHAVQAQQQLVQLSGLVSEAGSGYPLPYSTVRVLNSYRGTVSNGSGFFSLVVAPNDSIQFSSVGYQSRTYVVPDTITDMITSIGVFLSRDTMLLDVVEVYPWPSRDDFRDAFLALQLADPMLTMGPIPGIKTVVDTVPKSPTIFNPITLFYEEVIQPIEWSRKKRNKVKELPKWE